MADITVPQTSFGTAPPVAIEGMVGDSSDTHHDSALCSAAMAAGRGVSLGSDDGIVALPAQASDVSAHFQGFTTYQAMRESTGSANRFTTKSAIGVLRRGRIWLRCEGDMVDDGPVYVVNGSGGGTPGKVRGDANTAAATIIPNGAARCIKGALSGNLVLVEVNLP